MCECCDYPYTRCVCESKREIEYKNTAQNCYSKETKSLGGISVCISQKVRKEEDGVANQNATITRKLQLTQKFINFN